MKSLSLVTAVASVGLVFGLAVSSADAHPRIFPHSHGKHVVVKKEVVVKPVVGMRVVSLPRGYTTIRVDGRTLYRFNNVTYRRVNNYYIVV